MTRVLAVDPGFASMGWVLLQLGGTEPADEVVGCGLIETSPSTNKKERVAKAGSNTDRNQVIVRALQAQWDGVVVLARESASIPRSSSVAHQLGISYGTLTTLAEVHECPVYEVSPQRIKHALCGKLDASKAEIEVVARARYSFPGIDAVSKSKRNHIYDAAAVAIVVAKFQELAGFRYAIRSSGRSADV